MTMNTDAPFNKSESPKSAIDEERALPGVYTLDQRMPVPHPPAHGIPSSCVLPEALPGAAAIKLEQFPPIALCMDVYEGRGVIDLPGARGMSPRFAALSGQYTPKSPYKSAGIDADSHKRLHEPVLPTGGAPATVPAPGMLGVATELSPCSSEVISARRCFPPSTNTFRKNVTTSNRQQASKKRRSLGSRSNFFCDLEGCSAAFTRWQNLKEHLKLHYNMLEHICESPGCDLRFNTSGLLRSHARHAHRASSLRKQT